MNKSVGLGPEGPCSEEGRLRVCDPRSDGGPRSDGDQKRDMPPLEIFP